MSHSGLGGIHYKEIKKMRYRNAFHYIAGGIAGWFLITNPLASIGLMLAFMIYEIAQDWRKNDWSFHDILEFVVVFYVVATGLNIWEMIR